MVEIGNIGDVKVDLDGVVVCKQSPLSNERNEMEFCCSGMLVGGAA